MSARQSSRPTGVRRRATRPARPAAATRRAGPHTTGPTEQLVAQLRDAKIALHQALASFAERVSAQLERAAEAAGADPPPSRAVLAAMAKRAAGVKLKPERGRLKDLARLHELAEDLADLLPDA